MTRETGVSIPLEPVPWEGCGVCGALAMQREEARAAGKWLTVRQWNDELLNHPHERGRDWRP